MQALISDGAVIQLAPQSFAVHPSLIWAACPDGTAIGDAYDGANFSKPAIPVPTLADRLAALAAERYRRQCAGVMFQAAGAAAPALAASDPASTGMLTASYTAARDGHWVDGTPWKMADGSFVPLAAADMTALALKVLAYVSECFAREAALAAALRADLATDITQGWPGNGAAAPA